MLHISNQSTKYCLYVFFFIHMTMTVYLIFNSCSYDVICAYWVNENYNKFYFQAKPKRPRHKRHAPIEYISSV